MLKSVFSDSCARVCACAYVCMGLPWPRSPLALPTPLLALRGPFLPGYASEVMHWAAPFLSRLTDKVLSSINMCMREGAHACARKNENKRTIEREREGET